MKIKNIEFLNGVFLSPMAGYSDVGFRNLCSKMGAELTTTEMVSVNALKFGSEKTLELLQTTDNEKIKCVQLFGHDSEVFKEVVQYDCIQKFDIIDINMGCPAPKIFSNGDGSALLKDMENACEIVKACIGASGKPITVKMRLGVKNKNNCINFAKAIEKAGASAITVHGRTTEQGYSGQVDYQAIKDIKDNCNIPIIANGNIVDKNTMDYVKQFTNCDGVAIGRAALGAPELFCELTGKTIKMSKLQMIKEHIEYLKKYNKSFWLFEFRKYLCFYLKGEKNFKILRTQEMAIDNEKDLIDFLDINFK